MLFASTLAENFGLAMFSVLVVMGLIIKTIISIDNDGEIKKTASERVAAKIERWTK